MLPDDAVEVARIVGAWGVKGALKIKPLSSDPQALFSTSRWFIEPSEVLRPGAGVQDARVLRVAHAKVHGEAIVATVQDITDRDQAAALAGCRVFVPRTSFPAPADGEYYWVDLIGSAVVNRDGDALGSVTGLIQTGPHCVLQIRAADGADATPAAERLIPFVAAYVDAVDLPARRISVDWPASD